MHDERMREFVLFLFVAALVGVIVFLRRKKTRVQTIRKDTSVPMVRDFMQRTGYGFADAVGMPLEAQVQRWESEYVKSGGWISDIHLVRNVQGLPLHWRDATRVEGNHRIYSQSWYLPLSPPPRLPFHLSERSNLASQQRGWQPQFPRAISLGDPQLDARFVLYTPLDDRALPSLMQLIHNPQFRQALLGFSHVDLRVTNEGVTLSDPMGRNLSAMTGKNVFVHPGEMFQASLPLHERVASFLVGAASLAR